VFSRSPASTSNLGAGFDCLGLALDLWLEMRVVRGDGAFVYRGTLSALRPEIDVVAKILDGVVPAAHHIELDSEIPVGRGLGSSAAATAAALALRARLLGHRIQLDAVFAETASREGHPDNAAPTVYGGLMLAAARPTRLAFHRTLGIALALPDATVDTTAARAVLPGQVPRATAVEQAARAAALVTGLTSGDGDLLTHGMDDRLAVPHRVHLIPGFANAVRAGREAGAHGVTISGSGSTLVAVTPRERAAAVAAALAHALTEAGNPAAALTPTVSEKGLSYSEE
jgi:homoserine kinase